MALKFLPCCWVSSFLRSRGAVGWSVARKYGTTDTGFWRNEFYTPQLCLWACVCACVTTLWAHKLFLFQCYSDYHPLKAFSVVSQFHMRSTHSAHQSVEVVAMWTIVTSSSLHYVFTPYSYGVRFLQPPRLPVTGRLQKKETLSDLYYSVIRLNMRTWTCKLYTKVWSCPFISQLFSRNWWLLANLFWINIYM